MAVIEQAQGHMDVDMLNLHDVVATGGMVDVAYETSDARYGEGLTLRLGEAAQAAGAVVTGVEVSLVPHEEGVTPKRQGDLNSQGIGVSPLLVVGEPVAFLRGPSDVGSTPPVAAITVRPLEAGAAQ